MSDPCKNCGTQTTVQVYRVCNEITKDGYKDHDSCSDECMPDELKYDDAKIFSDLNKIPISVMETQIRCSECWNVLSDGYIMLDYCERCNSKLPEHLCDQCGQTTCETCKVKDCYKLAPTNEIMTKLWGLRENARALRPSLIKYGYDIKYFEGFEQDDIIPRWYASYAWIITKADINIELHMSSSNYGNRATFSIWIWKGVIPNLSVSQEKLDFINWKKVRVLSYLEELEYINLISHLNKIVEALT